MDSVHYTTTSITVSPKFRDYPRFSGSASFQYYKDELCRRIKRGTRHDSKHSRLLSWLRKELREYQSIERALSDKYYENSRKLVTENVIRLQREVDTLEKKFDAYSKKITEFKINKTLVRRKSIAFSRLYASKRFLGFITISFPIHFPDSFCYLCLNKWLTNLRKNYGLVHYLGVSERQKTGTLHFHLLVNRKFNIRQINHAMAWSIQREITKSGLTWGGSSFEKYNGVDIRSPFSNRRKYVDKRGIIRWRSVKQSRMNLNNIVNWVSAYLSKYLSKGNETFTHRCYFCSRSVSALFTMESYDLDSYGMDTFSNDVRDNEYLIIDHSCVTVMLPSIIKTYVYMSGLDAINDTLINTYYSLDS